MLGPDPAPRHAGWEEMLKCFRLRVAGGVPDVPPRRHHHPPRTQTKPRARTVPHFQRLWLITAAQV